MGLRRGQASNRQEIGKPKRYAEGRVMTESVLWAARIKRFVALCNTMTDQKKFVPMEVNLKQCSLDEVEATICDAFEHEDYHFEMTDTVPYEDVQKMLNDPNRR